MNFVQKVYYNDKPIIVTHNIKEYQILHPNTAQFQLYEKFSALKFSDALHLLEHTETPGALVEEADPALLVNHLNKVFKLVPAGGGVVTNEFDEVLLIFRRGKWDLPKGKRDKGETIEVCAVREVIEETGVVNVVLGEKVGDTWHLYVEKNKDIVKHTTWFRMTSTGNGKLVPQAEEDILEVKWVNPSELKPYMSNTYMAIKDVLRLSDYSW